MKRVIKRIDSGCVCERLVFNVRENTDIGSVREPRPRFKDEEEREQHRTEISRRNHERLANNNWGPHCLYCTMTFSNEEEVHTFDDARRLRYNYVNRLRRKCPDAVIFIYMGRGKHTRRIHFHMVCSGIPEEVVTEKWGYGSIVRIEHLRKHNYYDGVDRGQDYTGLANYLWSHWTPEQGGHRWKNTKNIKRPDEEKPKEIKREYSLQKPPRPPKGYVLVESKGTKYGLLYFKYVRQPPEQNRKKKKSMVCIDYLKPCKCVKF